MKFLMQNNMQREAEIVAHAGQPGRMYHCNQYGRPWY